MHRRDVLTGIAALGVTACAGASGHAALVPAAPSAAEREQTLAALRPPKRPRPVVAVLGSPHGSETTDLIVPYGVLRQSGLADVHVVSPTLAPMPLMPALTVYPQLNLTAFDAAWPDGADYVIVPAMHRGDEPEILDWIRKQSERGALICAICAGALVLSNAGLIGDRRATTHWYRIDALRRANPGMQWVPNRRYVIDRGVATTTGISASIPFSVMLVEAIGGAEAATRLAGQLGVNGWGADHASAAFGLSGRTVWAAIRNRLSLWEHQRLGLQVTDGVDEITLALVADAYSETYLSTAFAISTNTGIVTTSSGLDLVTSPVSRVRDIVDIALDQPPTYALDATLADIAARYGCDTAEFAALNLEYALRA